MDTYTIKLKRKILRDKTFKNVKANLFPEDMNPGGDSSFIDQNGNLISENTRRNPVKYMLVIFEDESRQIVNLDKFEGYEISKELFFIQAKKAEEESQGKAKI